MDFHGFVGFHGNFFMKLRQTPTRPWRWRPRWRRPSRHRRDMSGFGETAMEFWANSNDLRLQVTLNGGDWSLGSGNPPPKNPRNFRFSGIIRIICPDGVFSLGSLRSLKPWGCVFFLIQKNPKGSIIVGAPYFGGRLSQDGMYTECLLWISWSIMRTRYVCIRSLPATNRIFYVTLYA